MSTFCQSKNETLDDGLFIEVYRDVQPVDKIFGKILKSSNDFICMSKYTNDGKYNGIQIVKREDISYVMSGQDEIDSMELKIEKIPLIDIDTIDLTSIKTIIETVNDLVGYIAISVEVSDPDISFIGRVEQVNDKELLIQEHVSKTASKKSKFLITLDNITSIGIDGINERIVLNFDDKEAS